MQVNMNEAKAILPDLMIRAQAGEEIVIAGAGKSGVELVPVAIATGESAPSAASAICGSRAMS